MNLKKIIDVLIGVKSTKLNKSNLKNIVNKEFKQENSQTVVSDEKIFSLLPNSEKFEYYQSIGDVKKAKDLAHQLLSENDVFSLNYLSGKFAKTEDILTLEEKTDLFVKQYQNESVFPGDSNNQEKFNKELSKYNIPHSEKTVELIIKILKNRINLTETFRNGNWDALKIEFDRGIVAKTLEEIPLKYTKKLFNNFYDSLVQEDKLYHAVYLTKIYGGLNDKTQEVATKYIDKVIDAGNFSYAKKLADEFGVNLLKKQSEVIKEGKLTKYFKEHPDWFFRETSLEDIKRIKIPRDEILQEFVDANNNLLKELHSESNSDDLKYISKLKKLISTEYNDEIIKTETEVISKLVEKANGWELENAHGLLNKYVQQTSIPEKEQTKLVYEIANKVFNKNKGNLKFAEAFNLPEYKKRYSAIRTVQSALSYNRKNWDYIKNLTKKYIPECLPDIKILSKTLKK